MSGAPRSRSSSSSSSACSRSGPWSPKILSVNIAPKTPPMTPPESALKKKYLKYNRCPLNSALQDWRNELFCRYCVLRLKAQWPGADALHHDALRYLICCWAVTPATHPSATLFTQVTGPTTKETCLIGQFGLWYPDSCSLRATEIS